MELSPSQEANSHLGRQEISASLSFITVFTRDTSGPYPEAD